jgi:hypothetical protein
MNKITEIIKAAFATNPRVTFIEKEDQGEPEIQAHAHGERVRLGSWYPNLAREEDAEHIIREIHKHLELISQRDRNLEFLQDAIPALNSDSLARIVQTVRDQLTEDNA